MSYIQFNKEQLTDLEFSLGKEILLTNNNGAYCSTSLANCHTRKYHGLLVAQQPQMDDNRYVLLSSLDETIVKANSYQPIADSYNLATHRYPFTYSPQGYKHLEDFSYEDAPEWNYKVEDIEISKKIMFVKKEDRVLIKYSVNKADAPFEMRFNPFLNFRNIHSLSKANLFLNKKLETVDNGISLKPYRELSTIFLQFSRKTEFVPKPDWYYNVEYLQEQERGYNFTEDIYTPGYFKIKLKKGDSIIFSAGTAEINTRAISRLFDKELKNRNPLNSFNDCLENAAEQFIIANSHQPMANSYIVAGYHWFGAWGRDTFISLPGLTLATGKPELCKQILDANLKNLKNGLFPNVGSGENASYNSADASLWFLWALQQYFHHTETMSLAWEEYGDVIKSILDNYRKGTPPPGKNGERGYIRMEDNTLLFAGAEGLALTWMDAIAAGKPVTPRIGFAVELNALWYNGIMFAIECAKAAISHQPSAISFVNEWFSLSEQIEVSFIETFWNEEKGYLADCVHGSHHDWSIRPNQVIAASLPYSPLTDEIKISLLNVVKEKLLTPRGLRTLSPDDTDYKGIYTGDQRSRDMAYHQGTVWTWLLGHFAEACLKTDGENNKEWLQAIYDNFAPAIMEYGIGTIAEIYDGDAPHAAKGAISQAWSVGELLRMREMLKSYKVKEEEEEKELILEHGSA